MCDIESTGEARGRFAASALIWGGVLLLALGGLSFYPYVNSRLTDIPLATPPLSPTSFPIPSSTFISTSVYPTDVPDPTPTPTRVPSPSSTHPSLPSPTPAYPTRIVIPSIDVNAPIFHVSTRKVEVNGQEYATWEVLDMYAAGWHETSAPLGAGNTVLNGHNTAHGEVFRDLYTLDAGDLITVYSGAVPYTYTVAEVLILPEIGQSLEVRRENARYTFPTDDERLTLVTCHPYGSLKYRLIVIAQPKSE